MSNQLVNFTIAMILIPVLNSTLFNDRALGADHPLQVGAKPRQTMLGHTREVRAVAISPKGKLVASAGADSTIRLWDLHTANSLAVFAGDAGHQMNVSCVQFSPDGRYLLSTSNDKTAKLWDVQGQHLLTTLVGHSQSVVSGTFSPDGTHVTTVGFDKTLRIWNTKTGDQVQTINNPDGGFAQLMATVVTYSPDGTMLATANHDGSVRVFKLGTKRHRRFPETRPDYSTVYEDPNVAFSPDGKTLLASYGGLAFLSDFASGKEKAVLHGFYQASLGQVDFAFFPDGRLLAGVNDKQVKLIDLVTNELVATLDHRVRVATICLSDDGRWLAAATGDIVQIWELSAHEPEPDEEDWPFQGGEEVVETPVADPDPVVGKTLDELLARGSELEGEFSRFIVGKYDVRLVITERLGPRLRGILHFDTVTPTGHHSLPHGGQLEFEATITSDKRARFTWKKIRATGLQNPRILPSAFKGIYSLQQKIVNQNSLAEFRSGQLVIKGEKNEGEYVFKVGVPE